MSTFADEIKLLTVDPASRRLGEIADKLNERLDAVEKRCCGTEPGIKLQPVPASPATAPEK